MKIITCIKQVPDSEAKVKADSGRDALATVLKLTRTPDSEAKVKTDAGQVTWGDAPLVINPFDEYAVEGALQQKEAIDGSTVTALCIGPNSAKDVLKHALAMGADEAVLISDPALKEIDSVGAALILTVAIKKIGDADMVVFGRQTLDNGSGLTSAHVARILGLPLLGLAGQVKVQDGTVTIERVTEEDRQTISAKMPVVMSVVQSIGEPRYPSFMGIRKASKVIISVWSLGELGIEAPAAIVTRTDLMNPLVDETKVEMIACETPEAIAEALVEKILAEKVL